MSTWGIPFYAGWGLTEDQLKNHSWVTERRNKKLDLDTLIYFALIHYPKYRSITTQLLCRPETALDELFELQKSSKYKLNIEQIIFRWWGVIKEYFQKFLT